MKTIFLFAVIIGCSSAKVTKYQKLKHISRDVEVTLFSTDSPPPFDYEKVCDIISEKFGERASGAMRDYVEEIKNETRKCGARMVILGSAKTYGSFTDSTISYAGGTAIRQTSDEKKLNEKKINQMVKAVQQENSKGLDSLMENLNHQTLKRSSYDSRVLEALLLMTSDKGLECSPSLVKTLDKYHAVITQLKRGTNTAANLIFCENLLSRNYHHISDQDALISYIGKQSKIFFKKYTGSKTDMRKLRSFQTVYPMAAKEIKSACKNDQASQRCASKSVFLEIKSVITKLKSKAKSVQATELKKTADLLSI